MTALHWFLVFTLLRTSCNIPQVCNGTYPEQVQVLMPTPEKCQEVQAMLKPVLDAQCWAQPEVTK